MEGPTLDDAQHPQHDRRAYGHRHHHAQVEGVGLLGGLVGGNGPRFGGDAGGFGGDGNQGRFRHGGAEAQTKGEGKQSH